MARLGSSASTSAVSGKGSASAASDVPAQPSLFDFIEGEESAESAAGAAPASILSADNDYAEALTPAEVGEAVEAAVASGKSGVALYAVGAEAMSARLEAVAISGAEGRATMVRVPLDPARRKELMAILEPLFTSPAATVVSHDIKRDMILLRREGIDLIAPYFDTSLEVIAQVPNVCKHIHLPVQSGSSRILKLMNRKYTREWYLGRIEAIRSRIPECGISTDLFTGFHGETEEDFQLTLELMREARFDSAFMFKYSERPGTLAARTMPDNVPDEVKTERLNRMIALQNELSAASNLSDVGKTFEVLVEGFSKRSREQLMGRTSQNKAAVFPRGGHKKGDFVRVRVVGASSATLLCEEA